MYNTNITLFNNSGINLILSTFYLCWMFYNLNSWSDSEVRVLRRDGLAPEGHQGHGTKDFKWDITKCVGSRRGEPGTEGWGLPCQKWDYLAHLPETPQNGKDPLFALKFKSTKEAPELAALHRQPRSPPRSPSSKGEGIPEPGTFPRGSITYTGARTELSWEFARGWCHTFPSQPGARPLSTPHPAQRLERLMSLRAVY